MGCPWENLDRPRYTLPLKKQIDVPVIKVLTGVRRCGKTTIMNLLAHHISETRPEATILAINFESILGQSDALRRSGNAPGRPICSLR